MLAFGAFNSLLIKIRIVTEKKGNRWKEKGGKKA